MMSSYKRMSLSLALVLMMAATSLAVLAVPSSSAGEPYLGGSVLDGTDIQGPLDTRMKNLLSTNPEDKLDVALAEKMKKSDGPFEVHVAITDRTAVNEFMEANGLPLVKGVELPGMPTMRLLELTSKEIMGLASNAGVLMIFEYQKPQIEENSVVRADSANGLMVAPPAVEDLDVDYVHGAVDAWMAGFTGLGVQIAVIDTGFDMAHPDLQGQQARYTFGPYNGWPIAYDDRASIDWAYNTIGGWVSDTTWTSIDYGGWVEFDGMAYDISALADVFGNPVVSQSGLYHLGYHTDANLQYLMGHRIGVLVVDAAFPGVYDTVYVDIFGDYSFSDDKACTMGDEISYYDFYDAGSGTSTYVWNGGDGYADLSGGMVYWISDGANVYPGSDWLYGASFVPGSGDAVAFMGEFYLAQSHGTMTASAALAMPNTLGGLLGGMAPDAKLIAIPFTGDIVASWLFAEWGADAAPDTGDEANIVSNSYGWSETAIEAGFSIYDEICTYISVAFGNTLWFWSTGNGGPGYGTAHSPVDFTSVHVGAGTTQQYRYWLGYENDYSYTKWGDVAPFSNSGPTRSGKLNAEIIASGMYSLEPAPLNWWDLFGGIGDGSVHLQIGSGTSHATPTAAGGAALGYQAYMNAYMVWPDIYTAKAKLMAAADDMHNDPLKQGAGWLNAYTYVMLMGGWSDGVDTLLYMNEPAFLKAALYPGHVYGTAYELFPNLLLPGEYDDTHIATTTNYNNMFDANVNVTSKLLLRTGGDAIHVVTPDGGSVYLDITGYIPAGTDLLRATMYLPMAEFDPELDYVSNVEYWLEMHDWVDENSDGMMNITGGEWELYRYGVDGSNCNYNRMTIKDPLDRTTDGLIARLRPYVGAAGINLTLQLDYYQLQTFPWITFRMLGDTDWSSGLDMTVLASSSEDWEINVSVPADAPVGTYAAAIYVDDGLRIQNIPVVINVAADDFEFEFGGPSMFDTPYNNDITGIADKGWRFEVGDWRIFYAMPPSGPPSVNANLVVVVNWTELPTDVNAHVLAPNWASFGTGYPPFGPGLIMTPIASSDEMYMGAGTFGVGTSTGGPQEVISAEMGQWYDWMGLGAAPFAIVTRCPVMSGNASHDTITGYTTWLTINWYDPVFVDLYAPQPGPVPLSGTIPGVYDISVSGSVEARGGGEGPYVVDQYNWEPIWQDTLTGDFYQDLANAAYTRYLYVEDSSSLEVTTWEEWGAPDIDLGVWYDMNWNGVADLFEPYWSSATGGSWESVRIDSPWDGQWIIKVLGYTVTGNPGYFSLEVMTSVPGHITVVDMQSPVTSGTYSFNISYSVPAAEGLYFGYATFGFLGADDMIWIPFQILVLDVGIPEIQNLYPADGQAVPTGSPVITFHANDSMHPVVTGIDWMTLGVRLDWRFDLIMLSWVSIVDDWATIQPLISFGEGVHYLEIWVADGAGNYAYSYTSFEVNSQVDRLTAEFADPVTGLPIASGSTVALTNVTVRGWTEPYADVTVSTGSGSLMTSANETGWYEQHNVSLVEGVNAVAVEAMNNAGVTRSTSLVLVRDTICMLWVADVEHMTTEPVQTLSGWTDQGATVTVGGTPAVVNPDGTWEATITISEGPNSIMVEATDPLGNSNQVWVDIELDTTPPALSITSPADGSNVSEPGLMVVGTTDTGATVWVNGVVASDGSADWSASVVLLEGVNTVTVLAEDAMGNSVVLTITVEYIPPVYVTPEELAAVQAVLEGMINNLSAALAENVSHLEDMIAAMQASLAENVTMLEAQIGDLDAALLENVTALQAEIDALEADLAANVAALQDQIDDILASIAALQTDMVEQVEDLQAQILAIEDDIADLIAETDASIADLQDQMDQLEEEMAAADDEIKQQADDTDAFASMLMYLTLILFAIAIVLVGLVWYMTNSRMKSGGSGGAPQTLEEVEEPPSEVEKEFEALEKEIKKEES
jgi:hypothetical protein